MILLQQFFHFNNKQFDYFYPITVQTQILDFLCSFFQLQTFLFLNKKRPLLNQFGWIWKQKLKRLLKLYRIGIKTMNNLRESAFNKRVDIFESPLRYSTRILNSQLIRNSFSRPISPHLRMTNMENYRNFRNNSNNQSKSPARRSQSPLQSNTSYSNLKDTLCKLQSKIKKAQKILNEKNRPLRHDRLHIFDDMESISEIQSEATKKFEHNYGEQSTKLLSLTKNESSISIQKKINRSSSPFSQKTRFINQSSLYYVSSVVSMRSKDSDPRMEDHIIASFEVVKNLHQIEAPQFSMIEDHRSSLPISHKHKQHKTLLIDIDETILHCEEDPELHNNYDFDIKVKLTDGQARACINLRPYALTFLKKMSKMFQIIVFTASHESYIDPVLNEIDPENQIFSHRLYRRHCHQIAEGVYTKDLRMVNRKPQKMILLDNSPYSYIFQLENAIPILPYYGGPDGELPKLQKYLQILKKCEDVRQVNKQTFKLHRYSQFDSLQSMIQELYMKKQ